LHQYILINIHEQSHYPNLNHAFFIAGTELTLIS